MTRIFKLLESFLLPLPFPVVFIWWIILGGFVGSALYGPTYMASVGILPITLIGGWRVYAKHTRQK
jgi:hypothetical protein